MTSSASQPGTAGSRSAPSRAIDQLATQARHGAFVKLGGADRTVTHDSLLAGVDDTPLAGSARHNTPHPIGSAQTSGRTARNPSAHAPPGQRPGDTAPGSRVGRDDPSESDGHTQHTRGPPWGREIVPLQGTLATLPNDLDSAANASHAQRRGSHGHRPGNMFPSHPSLRVCSVQEINAGSVRY